MKLYHQTSIEKWQLIQKVGAILSENELLRRGLVTEEQLEEMSSTGELDREIGKDKYVYASHLPAGFGDVTLEIDLEALNITEAKVSTAGDWLYVVRDQEDQKYYDEHLIPASQFVEYLATFLPTIPNQEWFWTRDNEKLEEFIGEAMLADSQGDPTKKRLYWRLMPEIMFPEELPLDYVKKVKIKT